MYRLSAHEGQASTGALIRTFPQEVTMLRITTIQLPAVLRLGLAAAVLTVTRQAPAQQVLASTGSAPAGGAESAAVRTDASALPGRTSTRALNLDLWSGNVHGDVIGRATAVLERLGPPENALDPIWPVLTRWTVESPNDGRSFVAELFGMIDGRNQCMHLRGIITDGWKKGAEVQADCLSTRNNGKVALRILPLRGER